MNKRLPFLGFLLILFVPVPAIEARSASSAEDIPAIHFEAPARFHPLVTRLQNLSHQRMRNLADRIGEQFDSTPIQTIIAGEQSPLARPIPPWIVGYADGRQSIIVLLPERVTPYPYGSLEIVFLHELAHVLISRASGHRDLPRWFDEGLAMVASDPWDLEDRARLIWTMASTPRLTFAKVDALFHQDAESTKRAYVLAGAFVRFLMAEAGPNAPRLMLNDIAKGASFSEAFSHVMGHTFTQIESDFFEQQSLWNRWVPLLTSAPTLWAGMILLVTLAFLVQRHRARVIRQRWNDEDHDLL